MKLVRWILARLILAYEKVASPKGVKRDPQEQALIDERTKNFVVYQFKACPFCVKVRFALKKHSINVEFLDAKNDPQHREALLQHGGKVKVPCLRIKSDCDGEDEWLYESDAIIQFIEQNVVYLEDTTAKA